MNRRTLIRKAATFPKGSEERRTILATLKTAARGNFQVGDLVEMKMTGTKWTVEELDTPKNFLVRNNKTKRTMWAKPSAFKVIKKASKTAARSDPPSPEIQKLNAEFYKKLAKAVHESGKWTYLDDPKDGLALWIEEYGSDQKGLRALRDEIVSHLDSALKKLAPIAKDIDERLVG